MLLAKQIVVVDNKKSFNSASIIFMLEIQYRIKVFKIPPYSSSANGHIEKFHLTLSEFMRCVKAEKAHRTFPDILYIFRAFYH